VVVFSGGSIGRMRDASLITGKGKGGEEMDSSPPSENPRSATGSPARTELH
jgi:hypothetical protein